MVRGFCGSPDRAETIVTDLPDNSEDETPSTIPLRSLPALTTLVISLCGSHPSPCLIKVLCSIGSAPALTSIVIDHSSWESIEDIFFEDPWVGLDKWLSRIARHAEVTGGLPLTLRGWPEGRSIWEGFLSEFRESGEIKVEHK